MRLPTVTIDRVVEEAADVFVANRYPQPGEVQIPPTVTIAFDVFEPVASIIVEVEDVLVFDGAAFVNEWNGALVDLGYGTRVSLVPPVRLQVNDTVHVRASSPESTAFWSFKTYDWLPPLIESARPINRHQVRVRFNETVLMGTGELGDALEPSRYTFEHVTRPAAMPTVTMVERVADDEVIITTSFELSFGAKYMLIVADVCDDAGNMFLAPDNVYEFFGWIPAFPAGRRWVLHDFVPRMTLVEDAGNDLKLFLAVLQDTNNLLLESIDRWLEIIDPDTAPESYVDAMLVDLGNPFDFALELEQKRRLVKALVLIYKLKGTAVGIVSVVRFFLGLEVTIETFVGRGWILGVHQLSTTSQVAPNPAIVGPGQTALYSFRVLTQRVLTDQQRQYIRDIAVYMKGAQEHFVGIRDGSYVDPQVKWWTVGITRIGHAAIYGSALANVPTGPVITSFTVQ